MIKIAALILVLLVFAGHGSAQANLSGNWTGWMSADDFLGAVRLEIKDGSASTITIFFAGDKRSGPLESLKLEGDTVTFDGKLQPNARFKGTLSAGTISGGVDLLSRNGSVSGAGTWEVRRVNAPASSPQDSPLLRASSVGLPKPAGKYAVGRRLFYWTDESRPETLTADTSDRRRVFAQLWYPANTSKGKPAEYFPRELLFDKSRPNDLAEITSYAVADAQLVKEKRRFPLIVFSPGLGSSPFTYAAIIENLVSHGYVVISINHSYDSGPARWTDGTEITFDKKWDGEVPKDWSADERKKFFDERRFGWAADASFAVDQVKKLDIAPTLDFDNIGMLGHSFGGQAASIACADDARFKACANLDGLAQGNAVLPDAVGKTMTQPFLFFTKAPEVTDAELAMMGMTRSDYRVRERKRLTERWKPSFRNQIAKIPSGGYLILYPGISHGTFSDGPLTDPKSTQPLADRTRTAGVINDYILAFFNKYLMRKPAPLLDIPGVPKDVIVEFLKK